MTLPYVSVTKDLKKALRLIRFATTPEQVNQDFIKNILEIRNDDSNNDIRLFLRQIGFVNDDGSPSDLYKKFRNASTVGWAVVDALHSGYKPLYDQDNFPHELSDRKLSERIEQTGQDSSTTPLVLASIKAIKTFAKGAGGPMTRSESEIPRTILYITAFLALVYGLLFLLIPAWLVDLSQGQRVLDNPGWVRWSGGLLIGLAVAVGLAAAKPVLDRQKPLVLGLAVGTTLIAWSLLYDLAPPDDSAFPVWVPGIGAFLTIVVIGLAVCTGLTANPKWQKGLVLGSALGTALIALWFRCHGVQWFVLVHILTTTVLAATLAWVSIKQTSERSLMREMSAQVVGSDLESGYTFMYTWLANQFGHFMIGFAGTLAWLWAWCLFLGSECLLSPKTLYDGVMVAGFAAAWLLIWILKEALGDIIPSWKSLSEAREKRIKDSENYYRLPRFSKFKLLIAPESKATDTRRSEDPSATLQESFKSGLRCDSSMDIYFYSCGILTALMMLYAPGLSKLYKEPWLSGGLPLLTFFVLLGLSRWISADWLWRQVAFDKARLPFVSRFATTKRPFVRLARNDAIKFALKSNNDNQNSAIGLTRDTKHLIIIGPPKSGRTTAAVALGVEALLGAKPPANIVRYITLPKLLDRIVEGRPEEATPAFPPEEADLLIIDDVGAQTPPPAKPLLMPERFEEILKQVLTTSESDSIRAAAKTKRVIWVVGDSYENAEKWKRALEEALREAFKPFKCDSKACSIYLTNPIPLQERQRPKTLL